MPERSDHASDFTDPDKTDSLPVLEGSAADADVADDAVPLEPDWQARANARRAEFGSRDTAPQSPARQHAAELKALGDALISRDATILQMLQTLDERNAELASLQHEHAQYKASLAAAGRRGESELDAGRQELSALRAQAGAYLELLQTREWRREYQMSLFLARDDDPSDSPAAAPAASAAVALDSPHEPVHGAPPAAHEQQVAGELRALADQTLIESLQSQIDALESQTTDLIARTRNLDVALSERDAEVAAQAKKIADYEADAQTTEEQMTVLLAHLHEARRPAQEMDAERRRLAEELALSTAHANALATENRELRAAVEAARSAAAAPGSGEAVGVTTNEALEAAVGKVSGGAANEAAYSAELTRLDGAMRVTYRIGPRTRIGRATDCEMHIDLPSVSRHHALLLTGPNGCIIEDLRSTNGLFINGRMILRHQLVDGDILTIGEAQFEFASMRRGNAPD